MKLNKVYLSVKIVVVVTLLLLNNCSSGSKPKKIVYVIDTSNDRIISFSNFSGTTFSSSFGSAGSGVGQFSLPLDLEIFGGKIYILDSANHRLVRMDNMSGDGWTTLGTFGSGVGQFNSPTGLHIDSLGLIYIADRLNHRIVRMNDITGAGWGSIGSIGSGVFQFNSPSDIVTNTNYLYAADGGNDRVVRMNLDGATGWFTSGSTGSSTNQYNEPLGIDLDSSGRIYIADFFNSRIVRIDNIIGDGFVSVNGLGQPRNVHIGPSNQIYTSAYNAGQKVFRFDDMIKSNLVEFGESGTGDGQFTNPASVFVIKK